MGKKFDQLSKEDQATLMAWAKHEAILHSATEKNFGNAKREARAQEQAEIVAGDPAKLKRALDTMRSKACQDDNYTYVLRGVTDADTKAIERKVDLGALGKLPDFLDNPRSCTPEDIQMSVRALRKDKSYKDR